MDRNYKQKVKNFIKKENFYIIIFLCISAIIGVAVVSYKMSEKRDSMVSNGNNSELSLNNVENNVTNDMPNAERVENDSNETNKLAKTEENEDKDKKEDVPTASHVVEVAFSKPVDGNLLRGFTYPKPQQVNEKSQRTIKGIDIGAQIGTEIKSAADGIVEAVKNYGVEDGMSVVIVHENGLKTKYSNLSTEVLVKKGDKVTNNTVLGKVGNTAQIYNDKKFGEHLNLQVLDENNGQLNPLNYFEYKN